MFCSNCGEKNKDDTTFCVECGEKVYQNTDASDENKKVIHNQEQKPSKNRIFKLATETIILLVTIGLGIGGYFTYTEKKETEELHYQFALDVVKTLSEVRESEEKARDAGDTDEEFARAAFGMKEHIDDAIKIMRKWEDSEDDSVNTIAEDMLEGLEDLSDAADILVGLAQGTLKSPETEAALFSVKLEEGRSVVFTVPLAVALRLSLNEKRKSDLISYIERLFEEEIENHRKYSKEGGDYELPQYAWGAIILRNALIKSPDESQLQKIIED